MGKISYNIREAADAAGASERDIVLAVRSGALKGHMVSGYCVILGNDIRDWITAQPDFLGTAC